MVQRINFDVLTNLGSVAAPVQNQDAATKSYVDAQVAAGGFTYDTVSFTNAAVPQGNVILSTAIGAGATLSSITFTAGPGSGSDIGLLVGGLGVTQLWNLAGSTVLFTTGSGGSDTDTFTMNLTTPVTFPFAIGAGAQLREAAPVYTPVKDVVLAGVLTGAVANNAQGRPTLTINSAGSTIFVDGTAGQIGVLFDALNASAGNLLITGNVTGSIFMGDQFTLGTDTTRYTVSTTPSFNAGGGFTSFSFTPNAVSSYAVGSAVNSFRAIRTSVTDLAPGTNVTLPVTTINGNVTATVNGPSNAYIANLADQEIAARIGSQSSATFISNDVTAVIVGGTTGAITLSVFVDNASALANTLNSLGPAAGFIGTTNNGLPDLPVLSYASSGVANVNLIVTFTNAVTLAAAQTFFGTGTTAAGSNTIYVGSSATAGNFIFQADPAAAITTLDYQWAKTKLLTSGITKTTDDVAQTVTLTSVSPPLLFNIGTPYAADNVGIVLRLPSSTAPLTGVTGTVNSASDFGIVNITSTPWPPTFPTGYNTFFVGISDSTNSQWAGVGTLVPIATGNGIEAISWIKPPPTGAFTNAKVWVFVNSAAGVWSGSSVADAESRDPATALVFPEFTNTRVVDNYGNSAAVITAAPFIDTKISQRIGSVAYNAFPVTTPTTPNATTIRILQGDIPNATLNTLIGTYFWNTNNGTATPTLFSSYTNSGLFSDLVVTNSAGFAGISTLYQTANNYMVFEPSVINGIKQNAVSSLNTLKGDVALLPGTNIGLVTAGQNITINSTSAGISASNFTSFVTSGGPSVGSGIVGFVTTNVPNFQKACFGFGLQADTSTIDGGYIGPVQYINTTQTAVSPYNFALLFPVATTYTTLEVLVYSPSYTFNFTATGASGPGVFTLDNVLFSKASSSAASPPDLRGNIFPGFAQTSPGSDDVQLNPLLDSFITVTGSGTNFTATVTGGIYSGIINNYTHATATTTIPYLGWQRLLGPAGVSITGISNLTLDTNLVGGVRCLVALPGTGGATPTLQQVMSTGNSTNLPIVFQDTATTPKGVTLGSPTTYTNSYSLKLPTDQGLANQVMTNDGSGNLSWQDNKIQVWDFNEFAINSTAFQTNAIRWPLTGYNGGLPTATDLPTGIQITWIDAGVQQIFTVTGAPVDSGGYRTFPLNGTPTNGVVGARIYAGLKTTNDIIFGDSLALTLSPTGFPTGVSIDLDFAGAVNNSYLFNSGNLLLGNGELFHDTTNQRASALAPIGANNIARLADVSSYNTPTPVSTAFVTSANLAIGVTSITITGDATATFTVGTYIAFASGATTNRYRVTASAFATGITTLTISSSLVVAVASGTTCYRDPNTIVGTISTLQLGNNLTGTYDAGNLRIDATGGGGGSQNLQQVLTVGNTAQTSIVINDSATTPTQASTISSAKVSSSSFETNGATATLPNTILIGSSATGVAPSITARSSIDANVNLNLLAKGSGGIQLGTTTLTTSLIAANSATQTPTIGLTPGSLGDVLKSAGAGKTPYWEPSSAIFYKLSVRAATTPAAPLSAIPSTAIIVDGIQTASGDRILIKDGSGAVNAAALGIYVVNASATWTRATDFDQGVVATLQNAATTIALGSINASNTWLQVAPIVTVGTTPQIWQIFSSAGVSSLQAVLLAGKTATSTAANNLTLFSDLPAPITFANSASTVTFTSGTLTAVGNTLVGNNLNILGGGVGGIPIISTSGVDTNIDLSINPKGTGSVNVIGQAMGLTLSGGTTFSQITSTGTNSILRLACSGTGNIQLATGAATGLVQLGFAASGRNYISVTPSATGSPIIAATGSSTDIDLKIQTQGVGSIRLGDNRFNFIQITPQATGSAPVIASSGDTNVALTISASGTGNVNIGNGQVNYLSLRGATSGNPSTLVATGDASGNTSLSLQPSGNGETRLGNQASFSGFTVQGALSSYSGLQAAGLAANLDFVLMPKGTGDLYPIGATLSATSTNQPTIFIANAINSTTLGSGNAGQVITSNGNAGAPYWSAPVTAAGYSLTAVASLASGPGSVSSALFTQQFNTLTGVSISGTTWTIAANSGRIKVTLLANVSGPSNSSYTVYFSFNIGGITTNVGFGAGTACSIIQYNSSGFASSATGGTPVSATILRAYGAGDNFTGTSIGYINNSAASQTFNFNFFQNAGVAITASTQTMLLLEAAPY